MGEVLWFLPANGLHSNQEDEMRKIMDKELLGLDCIGQSGIPVNFSCQLIDFELSPWLEKKLRQYPNIQLLNSTYSHALLPFCSKDMTKWQTAKIFGDAPITFFAEFYAPSEEFIPTEYFLYLEGASYPYSDFSTPNIDIRDVEVGKLGKTPAIKYGSKIGIAMRDELFMPFLTAFQRFQRDPLTADEKTGGKNPLDFLLDKVEEIGKSDSIVVCPYDPEAPWIGSTWGAKIYQLFFAGVKARGLEKVFGHLSDHLEYFKANAESSKRPHRILPKWCSYEVQVKYLQTMATIKPINERQRMLHAIASGSDILSAWERKIAESKNPIVLKGRNEDGSNVDIRISYEQDVIDVHDAARRALVENKSYLRILQTLSGSSILIQRMIAYAKKYNL